MAANHDSGFARHFEGQEIPVVRYITDMADQHPVFPEQLVAFQIK